MVAYPFKLKSVTRDGKIPTPNASTTTLDSVKQPDNKEFEMPTGFGVVTAVELPTNADAGRASSPVESPGSVHKPETEIAPASVAPQSTMAVTDAIRSRTRPVSGIPTGTNSSNIFPPEEDPVSPLETPDSATHSSSFKTREYRSRDSRLGQLGADGMPTQAWPDNGGAVDSAVRPTPAPFKVRNPVYDARAPTAAPVVPASQPVQQPLPFKMRHTVYDSKVAPLASKPPGQQSEQTPSVYEMPGSNGSAAMSQRAHPQELPAPAHAIPRVPSPLASVAERTSKSSSSSTDLSPTYTSRQANTHPNLDHPAATPLNFDKTNGKPTLNNPLTIASTRPAMSRNSSTGPPPTPPPKDTPPTSPPPTAPLPALPPTRPGELTRLPSNSSIIEGYRHLPSSTTRQTGLSSNKFSSENLRSTSSSSRAENSASRPTGSIPAGAAAALSSVNEGSAPEVVDLSVAPPPKKILPPGAAAAQAAVQAAKSSKQNSPVEMSADHHNATAPLPAVPTSRFASSAAIPIRQESLPSPPRETVLTVPSYTIGDLSFEHDPVSPMESEHMERTVRPPLETFVTANEGLDLKAMTMGNKI